MRYGLKWPEYRDQWDRMALLQSRQSQFDHDAKVAVQNKARYKAIEIRTGVPWYMIAALHRRESDADFMTYLGNGEPSNRVTRLVPKGRGPFKDFEAGASDALKLDGLTDVKDWRLEKMLYFAEIYNGTGYNNRGLPSPYVWAGSNIQRRGKYESDGHFNADIMDTQPGVAPLIYAISKLDSSIKFVRET